MSDKLFHVLFADDTNVFLNGKNMNMFDTIQQELSRLYVWLLANKLSLNLFISKAFNTLNFDILLHKLHYYRVTGVSFELIRSYLTNRQQYVKFKMLESDYMDIKSGMPQGSILGPLLFGIYIIDLVTVSK